MLDRVRSSLGRSRTGAVLLAGGVRVCTFVFAQNYDGDTVWRTMGALAWSRSPHYIWHAEACTWVFGPLHFYLNGIALLICDSVLYSPRVVSLLFGVLAVIPLYKWLQMESDERTAWYGSVVFCFYTLHVRYSGVAAAEALSAFLFLWTVYLYFRFLRTQRVRDLVWSAAVLNLASMVRYENLMLAFMLPVLSLIHDAPQRWSPTGLLNVRGRALRLGLLFGVLSSLLVISRFAGDWIWWGKPLYSLEVTRGHHLGIFARRAAERGTLNQYLYTLAFWPGVTFLSVTPLASGLACLGILRSIQLKRGIRAVVLLAQVVTFYSVMALAGGALATWARFSINMGLLTTVFAGLGWRTITDVGKVHARVVRALVFPSLVFFFVLWAVVGVEGRGSLIGDKISSISPVSRLPAYTNEVIAWMHQNLAKHDRVLLDRYGDEAELIAMYGGLPLDHFEFRWRTADEVTQYLNSQRPRFVVYAQQGELGAALGQDQRLPLGIPGVAARECFRNRVYQVYELTYDGE